MKEDKEDKKINIENTFLPLKASNILQSSIFCLIFFGFWINIKLFEMDQNLNLVFRWKNVEINFIKCMFLEGNFR